jgi:hypothetical protein
MNSLHECGLLSNNRVAADGIKISVRIQKKLAAAEHDRWAASNPGWGSTQIASAECRK